ncbi:hypothetical protein IW262DRAFT_282808 [Armillaria fumosa]|nr:hypothetical protein IW262DRAFT_282808 [Armillaria fumosa]
MKITRWERRGRRRIKEDGVDLSIVTVDILKAAAAAATSIPTLGSAAGIMSCILQQISQAQQNTELSLRITTRCARALVTISEHLDTLEITPAILNNIKYFVADLHEVQDFVEKETNSNIFYLVLFAKKRAQRLQDLQLRVQDTMALFQVRVFLWILVLFHLIGIQITTLITLRDIVQRHSSSLKCAILETRDALSGQGKGHRMLKDEPDIWTNEEFDIVPEEELFVRNGLRLHSAKVSGKCAVVKVFEGEHALKNYRATVEFEKHLLHPHLLCLKHVSRTNTPTPFIVYHQDVQVTAKQFIAAAIPLGIVSTFVAGAQLVSGIASALSHLHLRGIPLHSVGIENFSIFMNGANKAVLSFDGIWNLVSVASRQNRTGLDVLGELCHQTFNAANELSSNPICCGQLSASLHHTGDTLARADESESPLNSNAKLVDTEDKGRTNRASDEFYTATTISAILSSSRREVAWQGTGGTESSVTLDDISRRFKTALSPLSSTSYLSKHRASSIRDSQTVGNYEGYQREKVTFGRVLSDCLVVTVSLHEKCIICGRDVEAGIFRCNDGQRTLVAGSVDGSTTCGGCPADDQIPTVPGCGDNDDRKWAYNKCDNICDGEAVDQIYRRHYRTELNNLAMCAGWLVNFSDTFTGSQSNGVWTSTAYVDGISRGVGISRKIRQAREQAACETLRQLGRN